MSVRPQPVSYAQHIRAVLDHAAAVERSLPSSLAPELTSLNARTKPSQSPQPPQPESPPPEPLLSIGGIPSVHDSTGLAAPGGPYENAKYANAATWHLYKALRDVHDGRIQVPTEELRGYVQAADNAARTAAQLAPILAELKARALHTPSSLYLQHLAPVVWLLASRRCGTSTCGVWKCTIGQSRRAPRRARSV